MQHAWVGVETAEMVGETKAAEAAEAAEQKRRGVPMHVRLNVKRWQWRLALHSAHPRRDANLSAAGCHPRRSPLSTSRLAVGGRSAARVGMRAQGAALPATWTWTC